jgi:hypothetical protein
VEVPIIFVPKESWISKVRWEADVGCGFWHSSNCASRICPLSSNYEPAFLLRHSEASEMMCSKKLWEVAQWWLRSPIMTMFWFKLLCLCINIWTKMTWLVPLPPYLQDLAWHDLMPSLKLRLKSKRKIDYITIHELSQTSLAEFQTHKFCKCFQ